MLLWAVGVKLDELQRSLPTSTTLWFCEQSLFNFCRDKVLKVYTCTTVARGDHEAFLVINVLRFSLWNETHFNREQVIASLFKATDMKHRLGWPQVFSQVQRELSRWIHSAVLSYFQSEMCWNLTLLPRTKAIPTSYCNMIYNLRHTQLF